MLNYEQYKAMSNAVLNELHARGYGAAQASDYVRILIDAGYAQTEAVDWYKLYRVFRFDWDGNVDECMAGAPALPGE